MEYRDLGSTGIRVPEVSFGAHPISGDGWGGVVNEELAFRTLNTTFAIGMSSIDTAHAYGLGHGQEVIGKAIKG